MSSGRASSATRSAGRNNSMVRSCTARVLADGRLPDADDRPPRRRRLSGRRRRAFRGRAAGQPDKGLRRQPQPALRPSMKRLRFGVQRAHETSLFRAVQRMRNGQAFALRWKFAALRGKARERALPKAPSPPSPRHPHQFAERIERDPQAVGDDGVGAPGGGELGDETAAVAHACALDDDPGRRSARRAGPARPRPCAACRGRGARPPTAAGRGAGRSRSAPSRSGATARKRVEPGALMGAARAIRRSASGCR